MPELKENVSYLGLLRIKRIVRTHTQEGTRGYKNDQMVVPGYDDNIVEIEVRAKELDELVAKLTAHINLVEEV